MVYFDLEEVIIDEPTMSKMLEQKNLLFFIRHQAIFVCSVIHPTIHIIDFEKASNYFQWVAFIPSAGSRWVFCSLKDKLLGL